MKKNIITILLTALILYTVAMMTVFTPKTEAINPMQNPFDLLVVCCPAIDHCCMEYCYDQICPDGSAMCIVRNMLEIDQCYDDCHRNYTSLCDFIL